MLPFLVANDRYGLVLVASEGYVRVDIDQAPPTDVPAWWTPRLPYRISVSPLDWLDWS